MAMAMENAHALVIGIANYRFINKLPNTVLNDARDIRDLLIDARYCGYPKQNVVLLPDELATKSAIVAALQSAAERCVEESTFFLYISSHGGHIEAGPHAGQYLLPVDAVYRADKIAATAISGEQLTAALRAIRARKVVVIFDCCHAGGLGLPKDADTPVLKTGLADSYYDLLQAGIGRVIMASSRGSELSYIMPGARNSLFTEHLLAALRGGAPGNDGLIRIFSVYEYVQPRVTPVAAQHPVFKADLESNFPIALRLGGAKVFAKSAEDDVPFDVYVSFVDKGADAGFVRGKLLPALRKAKIKVAISSDVELLDASRVVNVNRGIEQSKRTIIILSQAFVEDYWALFEQGISQTTGVDAGDFRIIPVTIESIDKSRLPASIRALTGLNFADGEPFKSTFDRLVGALRRPVSRIVPSS